MRRRTIPRILRSTGIKVYKSPGFHPEQQSPQMDRLRVAAIRPVVRSNAAELVVVVRHGGLNDLFRMSTIVNVIDGDLLTRVSRHHFVGREIVAQSLNQSLGQFIKVFDMRPDVVLGQNTDDLVIASPPSSIGRPPMTRTFTMTSDLVIGLSLRTQISSGSPSPRRALGINSATRGPQNVRGMNHTEPEAATMFAAAGRLEDTGHLVDFVLHTSRKERSQ